MSQKQQLHQVNFKEHQYSVDGVQLISDKEVIRAIQNKQPIMMTSTQGVTEQLNHIKVSKKKK